MDDFATKQNIYISAANFFRRHFSLPIVIGLAVLLGGMYLLGRYSVYHTYPELYGIEKTNAILAKVAKLIQLPASEAPTMATINDAASAKKTQPFLGGAQNGDILIVYPNAQEAILYRPSTNKLIAVGPVNNSLSQQAALPSSGAGPTSATASSTHGTSATPKQ